LLFERVHDLELPGRDIETRRVSLELEPGDVVGIAGPPGVGKSSLLRMLSGSVPARATCAGSPANNNGFTGFGYPCFRSTALPVVLLATDEQPISSGDTYKTPSWDTIVKPAFLAAKARLVGILGSGYGANTDVDLRKMATDTGAVDAANGNAPLVFDGAGANAAAIVCTWPPGSHQGAS